MATGTKTRWQNMIVDVEQLRIGGTAVTATAAELNILDGVTSTAGELNILDGVTATAAEINAAADVSARRVAIADGDYTFLAANSGKPHMVANVSADRTFTLPTPAAGLDFEVIATVTAADGHDWIIDTGSNTNYLNGGALFFDTDASPTVFAVAQPNGSSNSIMTVNLPQGGTRLRFISDGTLWTLEGTVISTTAPAFADQA